MLAQSLGDIVLLSHQDSTIAWLARVEDILFNQRIDQDKAWRYQLKRLLHGKRLWLVEVWVGETKHQIIPANVELGQADPVEVQHHHPRMRWEHVGNRIGEALIWAGY